MKIIMFGGALAMLGGGFYAYKDRLIVAPNVYAAPAAQVYAVLDAMQIPQSGQGPMGTLDITKHVEEGKSITWSGAGAHAMVDCSATLVALAPDRTRVDTACSGGGPSDGAAAGLVPELLRIAMTEQVDSTLRGRAYDKKKVEMAGVGAVFRGLPKMQTEALKMSREAERETNAINERSNLQPHYDPNAGPNAGTAYPGRPLDPRGTDPRPSVVN